MSELHSTLTSCSGRNSRRTQRKPTMSSGRKKKTKPTKTSQDAIKLDDSDVISRLPEALLQHILFFLPIEDAIPLSSVSKTWLNAWNSLPVLEFCFDHDGDGTLKEFVNSVDDSLQTLELRKVFIRSFLLHMNLPPQDGLDLVSDRFDDWVSLVMKNYVEEVNIRVSNSDVFYTLPQALFTSRSMVKLHLEGCSFPSLILYTTDDDRKLEFKFTCLKELSLVNIVAREEQVQKLVNFSRPFLEKLTIKTCPSVEVLILSGFSKLCYVEVNVKVFQIHAAPNLHTLVMYGLWRVSAYNCPNITTLRCLTWDPNNAYRSIQALISKLPLLETLQLFLSHNQKIKVESRQLRTLLLFEGQRFDEPLVVELDTPSLRTLYFSGLCIPFVSVVNTEFNLNQKLQLHHFGHPSGGIDGIHLHRLGKFSQNFIHPSVEIYLHQIFTENLLTLEELKEHPIVYHPPNVRMLVLECIPASSDYTSFLNCLFWSCHPNALVVLIATEETLHSAHRDTFIQFLCNELLDREENYPLTCCTEYKFCKCWRHYIADVKSCVYRSMHEIENPIDLPTQLAKNGVSLINTTSKGVVVEFSFQWLPYPVCY